MNQSTTGTILLAGILALTACKSSQNVQQETTNSSVSNMEIKKTEANPDPTYLIMDDGQRALVGRNNVFALQLFKQMRSQESAVVSPLSVSYLMGVLANGAQGNTQREIMKAIGCEGVDLKQLNELYMAIMQTDSQRDPQTTVNIANYVAVNRHYQVYPAFSDAVKHYYQAGVESLDFSDAKTTKHINAWCNKQTQGMIPSIIDQVDPGAVSYLMNAIFFKGTWQNTFNPDRTRQENFRGLTRDIQKVDMMSQQSKFDYFDNDVYQAIELPYGNGTYSMTVLLPREGKSIEEMMETIDAPTLVSMRQRMDRCQVELKMPRFTTETRQVLNALISKLGAPSIFSEAQADFSAFANGHFFVSQMLQKAKIEVNEEGTKAAAVTAAVMLTSAGPMQYRRVRFVADHPFVYYIRDNQSGAVLFMGQYMGTH